MLKIIGGKFKGKNLVIPNENVTRPTMSKIREAVFSSLQSKINYSTFLDLFAGSGAIGLEALSRGSEKVYMNEIDSNTYKILTVNVKSVDKENKVVLLKQDYNETLSYFRNKKISFDIVYLDPPYVMQDENYNILNKLKEYKLLNKGSVVYFEGLKECVDVPSFTLKKYRYGLKHVGRYTYEE